MKATCVLSELNINLVRDGWIDFFPIKWKFQTKKLLEWMSRMWTVCGHIYIQNIFLLFRKKIPEKNSGEIWEIILWKMASGQLQQYCLKWNNHQSNMLRVFTRLLSQQHFTDCILAAEGKNIKCHKVSLSPDWALARLIILTFYCLTDGLISL